MLEVLFCGSANRFNDTGVRVGGLPDVFADQYGKIGVPQYLQRVTVAPAAPQLLVNIQNGVAGDTVQLLVAGRRRALP
jgi:hypothetical protein